MAGPGLPTNIAVGGTTTGHKTHSDTSNAIVNKFDTTLGTADTGNVLTWNGSVYIPLASEAEWVVYVDDYAVGDGTTDDSAAIIAARNVILNSRAGSYPAKPVLQFGAKTYRVVTPDALYPAGSNMIRGYTIRGVHPQTSRVRFDPVGASSTLTNMNMITTTGSPNLLMTRLESISFESTNANASFAYLWSTVSQWGANWIVRDVQWIGDWKRVFGLDGDSTANVNSEMRFYNVGFDDTTTFADAFLRSGITSPSTNDQQDQFLNYRFHDCDFSYESGNCLIFDKGGQIMVDGGSWVIIGAAGGTFIKMGDYNHFDSVQQLSVRNTRAELRNANVVVIDNAWRGGHITFQNFNDEAFGNAYQINGTGGGLTNYATHIYRTPQNSGPIVRYQDSMLMGYHRVVTTATVPAPGKWIYDGCSFRNMQGGGAGLLSTATNQLLRYDSAQPKHRFVDCRFSADVNV